MNEGIHKEGLKLGDCRVSIVKGIESWIEPASSVSSKITKTPTLLPRSAIELDPLFPILAENKEKLEDKMWSSLLEAAKTNPFGGIRQTQLDKSSSPDSQGLIKGRNIAAFDALPGDSCEFGSNHYFMLCGLGGILSCGITHTMVTPLDLVKCRIQVNPEKYKSVVNGFRVTHAEDGTRGLVRGWAPTFFGYSIQGMFKFGLYEVFKVQYSKLVGEEVSYEYRTSLYLVSSASAEFFADIGLAPFEAAKVKIQTTPGFANTLREAMPKIHAEEGIGGFYKGLVPLWLRQIPYTMMKFACFERTVELIYKYVVPKPRQECSKGEQLVVTFAAGYIAGVFCAVVSHPADSVVSKLNQEKGASAGDVLKKLGFGGVWKGLGPRIVMIGTLTAAQWFIYDAVKVWLRMPRPPPPEMPASLKKKYGLS